jgi:antitoxin MazE
VSFGYSFSVYTFSKNQALTPYIHMYILLCMTTKVQKWGNSLAVRLPKELAKSMDFIPGTTVRFVQKGTHVEIQRVSDAKIKKYSLKELVAGITKENKHELYDWGKPMGKEVW